MNRQQLYINGEAVDMPSEVIKLKIESNIFNDASNIMTGHSYSITLPRTIHNDDIFALAYVASADTAGGSTHRYLQCSFYIDGVPMFSDGRLVLSSVEEKGYRCNLYFGLLNLFDRIKEEGLDVCDLVMSKYATHDNDGLWMKLTRHMNTHQWISGMNDDIYNTLDDDSKEIADYYPWSLLAYTADYILGYISSVYGITFEYSTEASNRIARLKHPLTSLRSLAKDEILKINLRGAWNYWGGDGRYYIGFKTPTMLDSDTIDYADFGSTTEHSATNKWQANDAIVFEQDMHADSYISRIFNRTKISVDKVRVYGTVNTVFPFDVIVNNETATSHASGATEQTIDYTWQGFDVDDPQFFIMLDPSQQSYTAPQGINLNVEITVNKIGDIGTGMWWNDVRNYPAMGVVNYINEILAHIGGVIVGSVNTPETLRIVTFDELAQNEPVMLDMDGVKSIKMTLDKLAQKNTYTHKENTDVGLPYLADGVIYTNDETLSLERKAFDSKFKVPRLKIVRQWEVEKKEDSNKYTAKWKDAGEYICGINSIDGTCINNGQDFESLINEYYTAFEQATKAPKVVEVVVRMSVLDVLAFNFEHPVYIKQLGCKYLVKTLETEANDSYKLTLVQI